METRKIQNFMKIEEHLRKVHFLCMPNILAPDWRNRQIWVEIRHFGVFHMGRRLLSVENYRFLKSFLSTPRLFSHLESPKQAGNSRNRKSETSPFQNFFPIQKILNVKKIRSFFVWIEVIFF